LELNELVTAAQNGDDEAFYELMSSCKHQLYRIAYSYLRSEQDALEAVQETTFRAYRKLRKLKDPHHFKTWVIRILINYCIDEQRRSRKERTDLPDKLPHLSPKPSDTDRIDLEMMIDRLDHPLKQIIILKYFEDLTIKDIAAVMGRPEGTIKTWLNRALAQLRLELREGGNLNV